jgi:cell wall-associated NlpC family hydrolase
VSATPQQLAQAAALEQRIASESVTLDQLATQASRAQASADAAGASTTAKVGELAKAKADQAAAHAATLAAQAELRRTAISAYVDNRPAPTFPPGDADAAYEAGIARAYTDDVVGTVSGRILALKAAERRAGDAARQVEDETKQARSAQSAALTARQRVQKAVDAAVAVEAKLAATLAQVRGNMVTLVDAAQSGIAWKTYAQLGGGRLLDFTPSHPLPAPVGNTARAIAVATAQVAKPYQWGAAGPGSFDCSGLMQWSWAQAGVQLPRVAADQQAWAIPVPISQILPGDLVFFGAPAEHVGMYLGNGLMIDAPHTGAWVEIVPIWWAQLSGFGRVHG